MPLFDKYKKTIRAKLFVSETFDTDSLGFMILEVDDLKDYYSLIEEIRDSILITKGYATINDISIGNEGGE